MKKIFIAHRASLGDTLLATPILRAIKETYPDCQVIHLCSPSAKDMLEGHPYIDKLLTYKKGDPIFPIIKAIWRADLAIILDYHYRSSLFAWLAGIPIRIGRGNKKKSFLTKQVATVISDEMYEAEQTMTVAQAVGIETKNFQLEMAPYRDCEKTKTHSLMTEQGVAIDQDEFLVIAPYSLSDLKDWPQEYYQQLIDYFSNKGYKTVIVGGAEYYQRSLKYTGAINLVGMTGIRETTYLISQARFVVCGCTSVLHFSATTNTIHAHGEIITIPTWRNGLVGRVRFARMRLMRMIGKVLSVCLPTLIPLKHICGLPNKRNWLLWIPKSKN